jgi:hypothetical protein
VKTTKAIFESSFFSSEFVFSMIKSSIMKSFSMKLFFDELMKLFSDDAKTFRRLEIFFAFVVTSMTKAINFSAYLFNQSFDQFIEIWRKFSTIFIKWTFLIISFITLSLRKNS